MLGASLCLVLAVLGTSPEADPAELVAELGSPLYATRESAEISLAKLGRGALPSLRMARKSRDIEIQIRASGLIERIEGSLLVQPTTIPMDFQNVPIDQVIKTINEQSGVSLVLNPEDQAALQGRRLTLRSAEPLPFWKAIDAVCQAGQLHFIPGAQVSLGQRDGSLLLYDGPSPLTEPVSDFGPFRVHLSRDQYQSEIQVTQRPQPFGGRTRLMIAPTDPFRSNPNASRQLFLNLLVTGEPRLSIAQNGLAKVTVAVDDKGQSLLVPASAGTFQHVAGYNGMNPSPMVRIRVDLARPEVVGQKIRLLRGTIPVTVATRKPDPLEVPIAGSSGKVFRNNDVAIAVQSTRISKGNLAPLGGARMIETALIELSITQLGQPPRPIQFGEGEPLGYRPDTPQQQIEILDADGNTLSWFPSGTFFNGEETRLALTIVNGSKTQVPALIRYHGLIRASADVPFEFRDLPMP
jgi:hypothetical protein